MKATTDLPSRMGSSFSVFLSSKSRVLLASHFAKINGSCLYIHWPMAIDRWPLDPLWAVVPRSATAAPVQILTKLTLRSSSGVDRCRFSVCPLPVVCGSWKLQSAVLFSICVPSEQARIEARTIGPVSYLIYVSMRHYVLTTAGDIVVCFHKAMCVSC